MAHSFQVGDRVTVIADQFFGRQGTILHIHGEQIQVQGDGGGVRTFAAPALVLSQFAGHLEPVDGLPPPVDGLPPSNGGGVAPTKLEPMPGGDFAPPHFEVDGLPPPVDGLPPSNGGGVAPTSQHSPVEYGRTEILSAWLNELESAGTLGAWLETERRGGRTLYRLKYHAAAKRQPHRVNARDVPELRRAIVRGRLARMIRALLRELDS